MASRRGIRIEARDLTTGALTANDDLVLHARVDGGAWVRLPIRDASAPLSSDAIPVHGVARIDVRAAFVPESGNASQARTARLELDVRLQDAGVEEPTSPGSPLPGIGAPPIALPLIGGLLLVGLGLALVRRAQRRS